MVGRAPKKSDNTKHYEILGVSKNASQNDLKKAYRKAATENHPDKRGDPEKFKELKKAYGVLSNPLKRELYDQYGEDWRRPRKGQDVIHPLKVSLEDLYNGTSKMITLSRKRICSECKGIGSGTNDEGCCQQCKGEKVVKESKELEVHVEKGMQNGQKIRFPGEVLNRVVGGMVVILQQKEHRLFKRKGDDLFVEHTLSVVHALFGFRFRLAHLDNRELIIESQRGEVVRPDQVKEINDEGMPIYHRPSMRGKLYIHFKVNFPGPLKPEDRKLAEAILYPRPSPQLTDMEVDKGEETTLHDEDEMRRLLMKIKI